MASVLVHPSQFPENVQRDLAHSLRTRQVNPKFLYISHRQSKKWLAVHEAHSPARLDPDCAAIYEKGFAAAAGEAGTSPVRLIGLGCGGGQKDARLLAALAKAGRAPGYTPCDVSLSLVLTASEAARGAVPAIRCEPMLFDLAQADDLPPILAAQAGEPRGRLFTFFGMIPNFEPEVILPRLAALIGPDDVLLFSANLAPGSDYAAGVKQVLPGYDNPETRDWLLTFLYDLGVETGDGAIEFSIDESQGGIRRITANFTFTKQRSIPVDGNQFEFLPGEKIRVFFSYRYTPEMISSLLSAHKLAVRNQWITRSGEEGLFLCRRAGKG